MTLEQIFIACLVVINAATFFGMAYDKRLSRRRGDTERVPEGLIFFMATILGGVGVYIGMFIFRHKTRKWYFQIGIPLLIVQNVATLYVIRELLFP